MNGSLPFGAAPWLGVMVLMLGMVALGWWAWRWSQKTILLVQAAIAVAQAVVIVLFVMRERKWQQQENLQKSSTPELKGSVSTNSAVASHQTESETYPPLSSRILASTQSPPDAAVTQSAQQHPNLFSLVPPLYAEAPILPAGIGLYALDTPALPLLVFREIDPSSIGQYHSWRVALTPNAPDEPRPTGKEER